jgi:hypothetical protein
MNEHNNKIKGGAFQVARQVFDSELWLNKPDSWKVLWIYVLGKVAHKTKGKLLRGRGYFNFTQERRLISNSITSDSIKKAIGYMRGRGMIRTTKSTRGMYIDVAKYDYFQDMTNYRHQSKHHKSTTEAPLYNNNDNNENNINTDAKASKTMKTHDETKFSDSYEKVIDADENEIIEPKKVNIMAKYREIISWAEKRRGNKFIAPLKQMKALKVMKEAGYNPNQIMDRWEELEKDKFYATNGIDFMTVVSSFDKRPLK